MISALLLLVAADLQVGPPPPYNPDPHTLVVSNGAKVKRTNYKTGAACKRVRDAIIRRAVANGRPRVKATCVPR